METHIDNALAPIILHYRGDGSYQPESKLSKMAASIGIKSAEAWHGQRSLRKLHPTGLPAA